MRQLKTWAVEQRYIGRHHTWTSEWQAGLDLPERIDDARLAGGGRADEKAAAFDGPKLRQQQMLTKCQWIVERRTVD
ncbi:MAG TPA: hypothetical protein VHC22_01965 [Pirellulales bacterium]|nr:hypothetical protein [Pirellulales bacterium]